MKKQSYQCMVLLTLLLCCTVTSAAATVNALIVHLKNGAQTTFLLNEKPKISFEGTDLKIMSEKSETSVPLADVLRFTYDKQDVNGITEREVGSTEISFDEGVLVVSQLKKGSTVNIFTADGKLLRQLKARQTGTYRLDLSTLHDGVYIIKADNVTYKVTKR